MSTGDVGPDAAEAELLINMQHAENQTFGSDLYAIQAMVLILDSNLEIGAFAWISVIWSV